MGGEGEGQGGRRGSGKELRESEGRSGFTYVG